MPVSVVQGAALVLSMFNISTSDLRAITLGNSFVKYAEEVRMVVPSSNSSTTLAELVNAEAWAERNSVGA